MLFLGDDVVYVKVTRLDVGRYALPSACFMKESILNSVCLECLDHVIVLDERHLKRKDNPTQIRRLLSFVPDSFVA